MDLVQWLGFGFRTRNAGGSARVARASGVLADVLLEFLQIYFTLFLTLIWILNGIKDLKFGYSI